MQIGWHMADVCLYVKANCQFMQIINQLTLGGTNICIMLEQCARFANYITGLLVISKKYPKQMQHLPLPENDFLPMILASIDAAGPTGTVQCYTAITTYMLLQVYLINGLGIQHYVEYTKAGQQNTERYVSHIERR